MSEWRLAGAAKGLACLCLLAVVVASQGADLVGSGERLQMLQKIQGSWQRGCRKIVVDGRVMYERTRLTVDFTHLIFKTTEYAKPECTKQLTEYQTVYAYRLGEAVVTARGDRAYAMDLTAADVEPGIIRLPRLNLVAFADGHLFFGARQAGGDANQRLGRLERQESFQRL